MQKSEATTEMLGDAIVEWIMDQRATIEKYRVENENLRAKISELESDLRFALTGMR